MAAETAEIVQRRSDKARVDPTEPLCLGVEVGTDEPVTLSRTEHFDPILITGQMGTGKTTLCQHLACQQFTPDSSLCYVTSHAHSLPEVSQDVPEHREGVTITPGSTGVVGLTTDLLADIGTASSFSRIQLGTDRDSNTAVLHTLIEAMLANRHQQRGPESPPCTLVLDGIDGCVELDQIALTRLFGEARKLRLHVVITTQTLTSLPRSVRHQFENHVQTVITGQVERADAQALAGWYSRPTAGDLASLPAGQWWVGSPTAEDVQEAQVRSLPRIEGRHGR